MIRVSHVCLASITMTGLALAQPPPPPPPPPPGGGGGGAAAPGVGQNTIGADVAFVLPVGDYADGVDFAVGAFGRFEHKLNPNLAITGRLGFLYNQIGDDGGTDASLNMIILVGGARYNLNAAASDGIFFSGELGINIVRFSADIGGGMEVSDSETDLTTILGGGYQAGKIQARAGLFYTSTDGEDAIGLMASVGYDFATL